METDFGIKRKIDQSSCNKDYSCLNGFCPSFVTVYDAEPRKPRPGVFAEDLFKTLPVPATVNAEKGDSFNIMITGIGGTGVITVAAILGMAAHIEGKAASIFDMTGLAQKNGAVYSHVRIASSPCQIHAQRLGHGEADLLLSFDVVAAVGPEACSTLAGDRTRVLANSDVTATVAFQFNRDALVDTSLLMTRLVKLVGQEAVETVDGTRLATELLGDSIWVNLFLIGVAAQNGLLPMKIETIERAVALNGKAVALNLKALNLGRLYAARPEQVMAMLPPAPAPLDRSLDALVARRIKHLTAYQSA